MSHEYMRMQPFYLLAYYSPVRCSTEIFHIHLQIYVIIYDMLLKIMPLQLCIFLLVYTRINVGEIYSLCPTKTERLLRQLGE